MSRASQLMRGVVQTVGSDSTRTMKRKMIVVAGLAVGIAWLLARELEPTFHRGRNQRELLDVERGLKPGMSVAEARRVFREAESPRLKLMESASGLVIQTPYEFGARNWLLIVDTRDGVVVGIKVRTSDSVNEHPPAAPPDREFKQGADASGLHNNELQLTSAALPGGSGARS